MSLQGARPAAATASLIAFYFEQLAREDIKVICIARLTHQSSGFKTKVWAAKNYTSNSEVSYSFYRHGRLQRVHGCRNAGGGNAE